MKVEENTEVRCRRPERESERGRDEALAQQTWHDKKEPQRLKKLRHTGRKKKEHHKIKKEKEREEEMGTQTERGRGIENPLKGERERMKKWQPHKGAWNSLLQGPCFFAFPSVSHPHSHTLSHLAEAVLNLGTLTLCQA